MATGTQWTWLPKTTC
ncbi:hypothetical protein AOLI_G00170890 [Acnodon oligacanthus]